MSFRKKEKPALNQPLQSKQAGSGTLMSKLAPLTLREQTPPTPIVISRSRLELLNHSCSTVSRRFQLVMCRSWIAIWMPGFVTHRFFLYPLWFQLEGINQPERRANNNNSYSDASRLLIADVDAIKMSRVDNVVPKPLNPQHWAICCIRGGSCDLSEGFMALVPNDALKLIFSRRSGQSNSALIKR
ncbi:hypothetical protein J6590_025620 [Homalodisca vitripennis]|nr:hypothetical protein J6590_025620 [Homalodisca vitripennis]